MTLARTMMLALLFATVFAAWLWATTPRAPSTTLIGLSAEAQEEAARARKRAEDEAALLGFLTALKNAAGPSAKECGALPLNNNSSDVISCGAEQLSKRAAFSLAIQLPGLDTTAWVGVVRDGSGRFLQFLALCDPWFCNPQLAHPSVAACNSLLLDAHASYRSDMVKCLTQQAP